MPGLSKKSKKSNTLRRKPRAKKNTHRTRTRRVKKMGGMYHKKMGGNVPLTNATIRNVVADFLAGGIAKTNIVNQYGHINQWNTSAITSMNDLFKDATNFNEPLGNWDVSKVTNMSGMFADAKKFNQPLTNWDVSNVTNMSDMFRGATSFNKSINHWDVSKVTDMTRIFDGATNFNQPINYWNLTNVR